MATLSNEQQKDIVVFIRKYAVKGIVKSMLSLLFFFCCNLGVYGCYRDSKKFNPFVWLFKYNILRLFWGDGYNSLCG